MRQTKLLTPSLSHGIKLSLAVVAGLLLVLIVARFKTPEPVRAAAPDALIVQVEASQGFASPGNSLPANFLVVVTDASGAPVTSLVQSDFIITNQFGLPGQTCGFSNNIVSFTNVLNGAYRIQVDLVLKTCNWVEGDYLAHVTVTDGARRGQAPALLSVKCRLLCAP